MSLSHLRNQLIQQRKALPIEIQQEAEQAILQKLRELSVFKQAKKIACYLPIRGEVPTQEIINAIWHAQKQCYVPIMDESSRPLRFAEYEPSSTLIENKHHILEPKLSEEYISSTDLDLVLVPLVGFEPAQRVRLGYGAGHYDFSFNFLLKKPSQKPYLIGLAYDFQNIPDLIAREWDVPMHQIITPTQVY